MRGFTAVFRKEVTQMLRDRTTLFFALLVPIFELFLFGVIDTNVRNLRTVVLDQSRSSESRELLQQFVNTNYFDIVRYVDSRNELREEIVAGRTSIGIEIPPDYARKRGAGQNADVLVLIDGSDSSIASQALAAANGVVLRKSLRELLARRRSEMPVDVHPMMLFNPDSRSANLLIPGLVAILLTFSGTTLTAFALVREKERGTLEQLMVTPVSPFAVVLGKILPYLVLSYIELFLILLVMRVVFRVPMHGSLLLLLGLSVVYLFALLALGLMISSRAQSQMEAMQRMMGILLPSILLSGYIFPLSSLPAPLRLISVVLPATHFISISRGIIIRGAEFGHLWPNVSALLAISAVLVILSARAFQKTVR